MWWLERRNPGVRPGWLLLLEFLRASFGPWLVGVLRRMFLKPVFSDMLVVS
jgi:hypothetical protein